ncbi:hypothetical protein ACIRNI_07265 [Streptomyces sp. NPDC093546]|uniref:hypothetical protein n=1 Tax=Streptomyces sp. NPDC093546 TaxID=3366040 RepID=UPI0038268EAC
MPKTTTKAITIGLRREIEDPRPGKVYPCDGVGTVKTVDNYTGYTIHLWDKEDGTGKERVVKPEADAHKVSGEAKSVTVTGKPSDRFEEPRVCVYRELVIDPAEVDGSEDELTYKIPAGFDINGVTNGSEYWVTAWEQVNRKGDHLLVGPNGHDPSNADPCRAVTISRTRPAWAPAPPPDIEIEFEGRIHSPEPGKVYPATGPGVVTFITNHTELDATFWDNEDGSGAHRTCDADDQETYLELNTKSITFSAPKGGKAEKSAAGRHLYYQREWTFRQSEDTKLYPLDCEGVALTHVRNRSETFWVTLWENADGTGRKLVYDPQEEVVSRDGTLTTFRAMTVSREKPAGVEQPKPSPISVTWDFREEWALDDEEEEEEEIERPTFDTAVPLDAPGVITSVRNGTDWWLTFWENRDGTGESYLVGPQFGEDHIAVKAKSMTYSESGPALPQNMDTSDWESWRIYTTREILIDQPEDGQVLTVDGELGEFMGSGNRTKEFTVTFWENADRTGKKQELGPGKDLPGDKLKLSQIRAVSVARTGPAGTKQAKKATSTSKKQK